MNDTKLKIAIVGAGGVGGYIAGKLDLSNLADITLIVKQKYVDIISQNGLQIIDTDMTFTTNPKVYQSCENKLFDVVFIATKSYDFQEACQSIYSCVDKNTLVIPLANGVDHAQKISPYLPPCNIGEGAVYIISHIKKPGIIEKKSPLFYLLFGSKKSSPHTKELHEILNKSGLKSKYSEKISYDCWKKYLFISSFATLTSYYKQSMDEIYKEHKSELLGVLEEIKSIANKLDIPIDEQDIEKVLKQAQNLPPNSKTSMQLDFEKGNKTELDSLTGYIVKEAKKNGIQTPLMQEMYKKLSQSKK